MKHMRPNHISPNTVLLVMVLGVLVMALTPMARPAPVAADLGDGHTTNVPKKTFDPSVRPQGRITRSLVEGESLPVCSTDFPNATGDAVERWNRALSYTVLTFEANSSECEDEPPPTGWIRKEGVKAIFVSLGEVTTDKMGKTIIRGDVLSNGWCPDTDIACVRQDGVVGGDWRTRYGRIEVIVDPQNFCRDADTQPTTDCGANDQAATEDKDNELRYLITHELGHALSLGDYFCNHLEEVTNKEHPDFVDQDEKTIMNTFSLRRAAKLRECNAPGGIPTDRDVKDYEKIYKPAAVKDLKNATGRVTGQTVKLGWDPSDVFVELDFEIQRKDEEDWLGVKTTDPNTDSVTLTNQPGGEQHYRVRARTLALCPDDADCRQMRKHVYGNPSNEVKVPVPFLAPANVQVTSRTATSLTVAWDTVDGADRYELKQTTRDVACKDATREEEQAGATGSTSYPFSNLDPGTEYRLCVRATLSANGDVASEWARVDETTKVQQLSKPGNPTAGSATTSSLTLTWTAVDDDDVDQYEVKHNLLTATWKIAKTRTSYTFTELSAGTAYVLSVRALPKSGSDRTASKWEPAASARTKAQSTTPTVRQWRDCLDPQMVGIGQRYRSGCGSVRASTLVPNVRVVNDSVCGVGRQRNGVWADNYSIGADGRELPGSQDFTIRGGDWVGLYWCSSSGAAGAAGAEAGGDFLDE